jgi:hypothetical protein
MAIRSANALHKRLQSEDWTLQITADARYSHYSSGFHLLPVRTLLKLAIGCADTPSARRYLRYAARTVGQACACLLCRIM